MELDHSVGPMLPMQDFDAPEAVRERFDLLCGPGAPSGRFPGVPDPDIEIVEEVPDERLRAMLRVPKEAAFFADHFARKPVYPASLLLDAQIRVGLQLAARSKGWPAGAQLAASRVPDMKMRSFIPPGEVLELRIDLAPRTEERKVMATTGVRVNGRAVASGKLEIVDRSSA